MPKVGHAKIKPHIYAVFLTMEHLTGRNKFHEILGRFVYKPPGKPTLVPQTDRRPEIMPDDVHEEFKEEK